MKKAGLTHAEAVAPWIKRLCDDAGMQPSDLELVVAGIGPGSFTGLRIALATAKGLALGASCSIVGVSTLDVQGWKFRGFHGVVVPVMDARKNRLYSAEYRDGKRISEYLDISEENLVHRLSSRSDSQEQIVLTGPYASRLYQQISQGKLKTAFTLDPQYCVINPYFLLELGLQKFASAGDSGESVMPLYLRKSEAEINRKSRDR